MHSLRRTKLPILTATVLLTASLSLADTQTEKHPAPVHHKAHKAVHHTAPKAAHHTAPKAAHHEEAKAAHPETPKPAHHSKKARKHRTRGQQAIDSERATQIQEALVREHYMTGKASGSWDAATQAAMRKFQADQGWQSKTIPDSRALIRLGLGPDHEHLLNPESAMTTEPQLPHGNGSARSSASSSPVSASGGASSSSSITAPAQGSSSIPTPAADLSPAH